MNNKVIRHKFEVHQPVKSWNFSRYLNLKFLSTFLLVTNILLLMGSCMMASIMGLMNGFNITDFEMRGDMIGLSLLGQMMSLFLCLPFYGVTHET